MKMESMIYLTMTHRVSLTNQTRQAVSVGIKSQRYSLIKETETQKLNSKQVSRKIDLAMTQEKRSFTRTCGMLRSQTTIASPS